MQVFTEVPKKSNETDFISLLRTIHVSQEHECQECGRVFECGKQDQVYDAPVDIYCPDCGTIVEGLGEEERRHRGQFRESLNDRLSMIADESNHLAVEGYTRSLEYLQAEIQEVYEAVETEIQRRQDRE